MIFDVKSLSDNSRRRCASSIDWYRKVTGKDAPKLAVISVGDDVASQIYVKNKKRACQKAGIEFLHLHYEKMTTQKFLMMKIDELNNDDSVTGILVQLPLPSHINAQKAIDKISEYKDVDGLTTLNLGRLWGNGDCIAPCTPRGIIKLLQEDDTEFQGTHAVIVGRSSIVGKPLAALLLNLNCTVTICHSHTDNLGEITRSADILIVAVGKSKFITADMVKPGARVIDVGINRNGDGTLTGDVDTDNVAQVAAVTPVPGGVGLMTVTALLENVTYLAWRQDQMRIGEESTSIENV